MQNPNPPNETTDQKKIIKENYPANPYDSEYPTKKTLWITISILKKLLKTTIW
jgi:hypothetical protein